MAFAFTREIRCGGELPVDYLLISGAWGQGILTPRSIGVSQDGMVARCASDLPVASSFETWWPAVPKALRVESARCALGAR